MKIRNGFVSNSSSSSFIIDATKYTCADVALQAAYGYFSYDGEDASVNKTYVKIKKNLKKLKDKNLPIYIESSEGIHVAKDGDKIYVDTDRGYDYDFDVLEHSGEGENYEHFPEKYYYPQYDSNILGKKLYSWDLKKYGYNNEGDDLYCKCRQSNHWILIDSGEVMCPACNKKPDGKYIKQIDREKKFKKINKK